MKKLLYLFIIIAFVSCKQGINYPETKKVDQTDDYFGTIVEDPYRWLEDDRSAETEAWVKAQNEVTFGYLDEIPYREKIRTRLEQVWNYPKMSVPFTKAGHTLYFKNDGLQNQSVLFIKVNGEEEKVLIDPNTLSDDGTVALAAGMYSISKDGKYFAYGIARAGSDWREIKVRDIETGEDLDDLVKWVKFSGISWYKDGFFYSSYDKPEEGAEYSGVNEFHKIYYHKLGTSQDEDQLIYNNKEFPKHNFSAQVTSDEKYLIIYETESTNGNLFYVKNLQNTKSEFIRLTTSFDYDYRIIDSKNDQLFVLTNYKSPKYKLVRIDVKSLEVGKWHTVLPETSNVLESVDIVGDKIIANYIKDAHSLVQVFDIEGDMLYNMELPTLGTVGSISTNDDTEDIYYSFSSFTFPQTVYKYDIENNMSEVYFKPEVDVDADAYETKQVFYRSKDGTQIPMFITHKKGIKLDGTNPTMLYAYGGFNISIKPGFSASNMVLLENGGVYAVANIRGGGEYGEKWHKAGMKFNKQNVFDDFIAAAEYLITEKYTSSEKLAIKGGSNGGLLIGAVVNQRPDLFGVAFPFVGVMDMLRFHKFTIGWAWANEYGSSDDSAEFVNLYKYSPLHTIQKGVEYPATMVFTADHDDRVVPAHSFKYIATLQEKNASANPTLIRIQTNAGHGAGTPTSIRIQEAADQWAFMFYCMNENL